MVFGILILLKLKKSFPDFYVENRNKLIGSTLSLCIPMFLRTVWDILLFFKNPI